jgi:tetratricopeptide (TPR) repeat protein
MKKIFLLLFTFLLILPLMGQENEMGTPWTGRTLSSERGGTNELYLLQQGAIYNKQMKFEEMYFAYDKAVAKDPTSAIALINRAIFKKRFGMLSEAEEDYEDARRLNPYVADLYGYNGPFSILSILAYDPGEAVYQLGMAKRLQNYYNIIDDAYLGERFSALQLEYLESAIIEIERSNYSNALDIIDAVISNNKKYALPFDLKGMVLTKLKYYDQARIAFDEAIRINPNFGSAYVNYGLLEQQSNQGQLAMSYFDRSIEVQPDLSKAYFARALLNQKLGYNEAAIKDYDKIIELEGEGYIEAYLNRGLNRKMLGEFSLAINDINTVIEQQPNNAKLLKNRGNVYLVYGYNQRAIEDYSQAIQINPNYAEAYYNRALVHFKTHDYISGCYDLQKSLDLGFSKAEAMIKYFCVP